MRIIFPILILLYLFFGAGSVFAVTVTISNNPSTISDQPFNLDVSISGAQSGINYLRANLFSTGTTKYFGYTFNGTDFVNNSDYSQYFPVTIDSSGSWTGIIQAKLDSDSSYYTGPGEYNLKVRRYTQSGSSYTWSNEVSININFATPTPTPSPTPTPTSTPTPKPTPTSTPTPAPKKSTAPSSASPKPPPTITPSPSSSKISDSQNSVAGVTKTPLPSSSPATSPAFSPTPPVKVASQKQNNSFVFIGIIFIIAGIGSLGYIYLLKNEAIYKFFRRRN